MNIFLKYNPTLKLYKGRKMVIFNNIIITSFSDTNKYFLQVQTEKYIKGIITNNIYYIEREIIDYKKKYELTDEQAAFIYDI